MPGGVPRGTPPGSTPSALPPGTTAGVVVGVSLGKPIDHGTNDDPTKDSCDKAMEGILVPPPSMG